MNVRFKILALIIISLSLNFDLFSQWTCRSKLANHLKPFSKDFPLSWGIESTIGHGYMNDREITNAMMFVGLDYSFGHHQFYFEGGGKSWRNTLDKKNNHFFNKRYPGIREGFYKYYDENNTITLGFQQFLAGDYFLVRERGTGLSYKRKLGRIDIDVNMASVLKDYSRFGSFCSVHYLYNVVRDRHYPYLGEEFGDSNFASFVIKFTPSKSRREKKASKKNTENEFEEFEDFEDSSSEDEFEDFEDGATEDEFDEFENDSDEFEDFDEISKKAKPSVINYFKKKLLYETGMVLYREFGNGIDVPIIYVGAFADLSLPYEFSLKSELLHQEIENQRALIYHFKLSKSYKWKKGNRTSFALGYYGKLNFDENAKAQMSYSNLFIGEVMRLDAYDMPMYQLSAKHNFPKIRLHIKLQAVKQLNDDEISELNIAVGKTFFKNIKLTSMFSKMEANSLNDTFYMGRLEMRITI
ncbi:MAG: hypothetical protein U9R19_10225 [Bacteroidota bacterium]|nr:hypothetical protein [Bacteroidota bacterium]